MRKGKIYVPQADIGIFIKDDSWGIDWQISIDKVPFREKDTLYACLKNFDTSFSINMNIYPELE